MSVNENCSDVQTANYLRGVYWIKFGAKKGVLSLFLFSGVLFYTILELKANKK